MECMEAMRSRHSVRRFLPDEISEELLRALVEAAVLAPTASNLQAWRFFVLTEPALVRKVDLFCPGLSGRPPVIIAIASDLEEVGLRGSENSLEYGCQMDAAMAAENLMLRATELGLGTCAIKSYNEAAVRKLLKLPERYRLELLLSVGYPDGKTGSPRRKELAEVLFWNAWSREEKK